MKNSPNTILLPRREGTKGRGSWIVSIKLIILVLVVFPALYGCGSSSAGKGGDSPSGTITAPYLTDSTNHAGGQGWKRSDCFACHPMAKLSDIHKRRPKIWDSLGALGTDAYLSCMACHGTNGVSVADGGVQRCLICHGRTDIFPAGAFGDATIFTKAVVHDIKGTGSLTDDICIICHDRPDMNGVFDPAVDLTNFSGTASSINDFCLSCHDANGASGILSPALTFDPDFTNLRDTFLGFGSTEVERLMTADIHGAKTGGVPLFGVFRGTTYKNGMVLSCVECHYPHSSGNPYLITESGASTKVDNSTVLKATVKVTNNRFNELCALCHTNPDGADAGNGLHEVVHKGFTLTDCTDCHFHGGGYGSLKSNLF